ncbi:MAG: fibronectin type III domain-containing protein [Eubacterium sp.]|nr:fibronectin type III domain-containing protein [Eubacterium sp.]
MNNMILTNTMKKAVIAVITMLIIAAGILATGEQAFAADDKTPLGANPVELDQDVTGETYYKYDEYKYYKFTTLEDNGIEYSIKMINTGENGIKATLFDSDLHYVKPVGGTYYSSQNFGPSAGKWYTPIFDLGRESTYYIAVFSRTTNHTSTFSFRVNATVKKPAQTFLNKVSARKKAVKVTWHKANLADKYEVSIKKQGGSWKSYTTGKTGKTIKGLKSGKKYTVRVRAIREYNGKEYKGKWSAKLYVKVK